MRKAVSLLVKDADKESRSVSFPIDKVYCAGFSGRNQRDVQLHVEELRKLGVPTPGSTPNVYLVSPYMAFTSSESTKFEVKGNETSGEVEFVVILSK